MNSKNSRSIGKNYKINFRNMWLRMVPQMVTQSLRKDAELKSSVYHELCDARQ